MRRHQRLEGEYLLGAVAALFGTLPFDRRALRALHRLAGGVPRKLNLLADRSLLGAYSSGVARVDAAIVRRAAAEVFAPRRRGGEWRWQLLAVTGVAALSVAAAWTWQTWRTMAPTAAALRKSQEPEPPGSTPKPLPAVLDDRSDWQALAALWGEASAAPCDAETPSGLRCYRSASFTLAQIRQLDRQGLVTLRAHGEALKNVWIPIKAGKNECKHCN